LCTAGFIQKIFAIKPPSRRKTEQMYKGFGPIFLRGAVPRLFYGGLLVLQFTVHSFANFGWVPFADLRLQTLAMKQNAKFMESG